MTSGRGTDGSQAAIGEDGVAAAERLDRVRRRFREFAVEYSSLPLYGVVSRHVADDPATAVLLTGARPGQARPVLWFAALHDLVLRRPEVPAARWYASVAGRDALPVGDPWPDVRATVLEHADEIAHLIATRTTQTNEVNRSVYLAAGLAAATRTGDRSSSSPSAAAGSRGISDARHRTRVALVELGASARLLLGLDRYRITTVSESGLRSVVGDPASPVRCEGVDRSVGRQALQPLPQVVARVGLDRHPVSLDDEDAVRWLLACLWPDVPGRVERFQAARSLLLPDPPLVLQGDLVEDLGAAFDAALDGAAVGGGADHVVVYSSWALTYVAPEHRSALAEELSRRARSVPRLTWLTAEPPGCVPGLPHESRAAEAPTVLGLRTWFEGVETPARVVGVAHPHGAWVRAW
ncbi:DUF2332 domain-containing protein [Terrabacter sp. NPDC080008]|uniref:DUF2332 domain-containing protein n=1 Tax=Terrabacter sp. NPDC080008 TaxID=3155176 RepID=UPI00344F8ED1